MGSRPIGNNPAWAVEGLSSDADFVVVHDGQSPHYVDFLEKEQGPTNRLTDPLFAGWMHLQADNTECPLGRKSHHISEIGIQCHEYAAVLNGEAQDLFVGGSREAGLQDRNGVVPLRSQLKGMLWGKVFVRKKLHWFARTISSAA